MSQVKTTKLGPMFVGAAKVISEDTSCTYTLQNLYRSNKRFWNKKCEAMYRELSQQDDYSTVESTLALHLIILGECNSKVKTVLIEKLLHVHFRHMLKTDDEIPSPRLNMSSSEIERVGAYLLLTQYYRYATGTGTDEDKKYQALYPEMLERMGIEHIIDDHLKEKQLVGSTIISTPDEKASALARYILDFKGIRDQDVANISDAEKAFLVKVLRLVCDSKSDQLVYKKIGEMLMRLAGLAASYRASYLKAAIKPEINHSRACIQPGKNVSDYQKEIDALNRTVATLQSRLNESEAVSKKALNDLDKTHRATIAGLNKEIKLLQSGKSKK